MARSVQTHPDIPSPDQASGCAAPRSVYDLVGHQQAEQKFLTALSSGRMHHAWMVTGPPSIGKATLAYRMVRKLLGGQSLLDDSLDIPQSDPVAQRLESLGHGDFYLLRRPYDDNTKKLRRDIPVSEARKLRSFFSHKPAEGGWRVCLIDSMDEMNRNAENAILKTLEEPPQRAVIIMLASKPGQLLPTIHSRSIHLNLKPVSEDEIRPWLTAQSPISDPMLIDAAIKLSRGAPGKALMLTQNADTVLIPLADYMKSLGRSDASLDYKLANHLSTLSAEDSRALFWEALQDIVQAQALYSATGQWQGAFEPISLNRDTTVWTAQWARLGHLQNREAALNMDKKSVMLDALSSLRAA